MNKQFFYQQRYLYLVCFIFFAQFFIVDVYYFDDFFRARDGSFGWRGDGRALAGVFYKILLQFQSPLPDIYPLPLLVAGFLFCMMCYLAFSGFGFKDHKQQALLLLGIIASPLMLSNWLFRYDSAFMLLSVGFALLPFYFVYSHKAFFISAVLSLLGALMTYQVSVNIFIGLTAIYALKLVIEQYSIKKMLVFIGVAILAFLTAYLVYSQVILRIMPPHSYAGKFQEVPKLSDLLGVVVQNSTTTLTMFKSLLKSGIIAPLVFGIVCNVYAIYRFKAGNKFLISLCYICALITALFSISGVMLVSQTAPFMARTYVGLIVLLILPSMVLLLLQQKTLFYISIIFMCLASLVIDRATLNGTAEEYRFHNSLASQVRTELSMHNVSEMTEVVIIGQPPLSNVSQINSKIFPIIKIILPVTFFDGYDAGRYVLMHNGFQNIVNAPIETRVNIINQLDQITPIASNQLYQLYYLDGIPVIKFKQ